MAELGAARQGQAIGGYAVGQIVELDVPGQYIVIGSRWLKRKDRGSLAYGGVKGIHAYVGANVPQDITCPQPVNPANRVCLLRKDEIAPESVTSASIVTS